MQFGIGEWKTRDGRKAVVERISATPRDEYPLEGSLDDVFNCWTMDGRYSISDGETSADLVGPWEEDRRQAAEQLSAKENAQRAEAAAKQVNVQLAGDMTALIEQTRRNNEFREKAFCAALTGLLACSEIHSTHVKAFPKAAADTVRWAKEIADEAVRQWGRQ